MSGEELELCCGAAEIYLPRCISAFVGADITTALLCTGICGTEGDSMMVDVGTNGEIVLPLKAPGFPAECRAWTAPLTM